jgi:hypothetical protein
MGRSKGMTAQSIQIATRAKVLSENDFVEYLDETISAIRAEARAEALRDAADRAWNFLKVNPYCYRWNEKELRAAITQEA